MMTFDLAKPGAEQTSHLIIIDDIGESSDKLLRIVDQMLELHSGVWCQRAIIGAVTSLVLKAERMKVNKWYDEVLKSRGEANEQNQR